MPILSFLLHTCVCRAERVPNYRARERRTQATACIHVNNGVLSSRRLTTSVCTTKKDLYARYVSLYKILYHFKALLWKSIILFLPPPNLQSLPYRCCTPIARYTTPRPTPPLYAIHHNVLVMAISCKGQTIRRVFALITGRVSVNIRGSYIVNGVSNEA